VRLEVESIDRMYLNVYIPKLQRESGASWFLKAQRKYPVASSAAMAPISRAFVEAIEEYAQRHQIPLLRFEKGQRKDDVVAPYLRQAAGREGIVLIGKAQEKTTTFSTGMSTSSVNWRKRGSPIKPWIMGFSPARIRFACKLWQRIYPQRKSKHWCANGWRACRNPSRPRSVLPGMIMTSPFCNERLYKSNRLSRQFRLYCLRLNCSIEYEGKSLYSIAILILER
jgi:hypothetical protein